MSEEISCFKAYDIRGQVPSQLNEDIAYRIGRAYVELLSPKRVVVGYDIRLTSESICAALSKGLMEGGADVISIGQCGTEEVYFATSHLGLDGGIAVTASHNPKDYNGMKLVREDSKPISADTGLFDIKRLAEKNHFTAPGQTGQMKQVDTKPAYIQHLLEYIDIEALKPLTIVCNAGNGGAGPIIDLLEQHLPGRFIKVQHEPDGNFPNGVPNPLLEENRQPTIDSINAHVADIGIAWDGDFDRCFFFDEAGQFVPGEYVVGLLASIFLEKEAGAKIVHDPRVIWNTQDIVAHKGGIAVQSKTGHAFIKQTMRSHEAVYGGEMSAHHYFRDFAYCDSGMIPWLLIAELVSRSERSLGSWVKDRFAAFPSSGEMNFKVADTGKAIESVLSAYRADALSIDETDGVSLAFEDWRFNLRQSNTEPLVRLNVESKGKAETLVGHVSAIADTLGGARA